MIPRPRNTSLANLRPTLFTILTVLLIAVASYPVYQSGLPEAHATRVSLSLFANFNGWNYSQPTGKNPTITVLETDNVYISLSAADTQQHQFYVDMDRNGVNDCPFRDLCSGVFNSTSPTTRGWSSGIIPEGTYHYYDSYSQATTNGTLIIQPGPYPATANISLMASANGWNYSQPSGPNPTIIVRFVQNVGLHFGSVDPAGVQHKFYIDIDKNGVPDCSGQDYCGPQFDSTVSAGAYWGAGYLPPGTYHYYDTYNQAVSNGTFIILPATPDYYISASPFTLTIQQSRSQTSTIRVTSENNFTGTISLAANPSSLTATLNPTSVSPPKNGIATSTLNLTSSASLSPGSYQVGITASNGTTQRSTTVNVQVIAPDFIITANTNTLNIIQGSSSTATITITSQNGLSGTVSLRDQITPNRLTASQNPSSINIASGGIQTSTLTVSTTPTTPIGTYTISITGNTTSTNGPLTHSITITLSVNPQAATSPGNPLISTFLFEVIAILILVVSLVIVLARHRSNRQKSEKSKDPMLPR
jgi:hypothetical protein